ncbi:MAG: outer membrane insertion C- signal [Bacteroidota bacterium]
MKRISIVLVLVGLFSLYSESTNAQEVGIRVGNVVGGNVALDILLNTNKFGLLHADISISDAGVYGTYVGVEALSDFLYEPLGGEALNLYLGIGPSLLFANDFWMGGSFEAGLDYHFNALPISIGGDWRPTLWLVGPDSGTDFDASNFGFNLRFVFGR